MKKAFIALVILFVVLVVGILVIGRTFYPDNIAETSSDGGIKQLKTRIYESDPGAVRIASKEVIKGLTTWGGAWKLTDETDGGAVMRLKAEVPVVVFIDDIEITIKETKKGSVSVDARSQSRVGKSDFGENARHVRKFLNALDEKLK